MDLNDPGLSLQDSGHQPLTRETLVRRGRPFAEGRRTRRLIALQTSQAVSRS